MADQDRRALELGDDARDMLDRVGHGDALDRSGIRAQRLDFDLEARIGGRDYAEPAALVAGDPALPHAGGHPKPVDQDDRVGVGDAVGGHVAFLPAQARRAVTPRTRGLRRIRLGIGTECARAGRRSRGPQLQLEVTRVGHGFESWRSFATVTSTAAVTAKSTNMIGARIHI